MELLIVTILLFIFGIFVLLKSSVFAAKYLEQIARFLGISEFSASFILMAFATTLPEFAIGINSALSGSPEISLGNILGGNIVTLSLILGIVATIAGNIKLNDHGIFTAHRIFTLSLTIAPVALLLDGMLSRIDGAILVCLFFAHIAVLVKLKDRFRGGKTFNHSSASSIPLLLWGIRKTFKSLTFFTIAVVFLIGGSYIVVYSAHNLSLVIGLPEILIGIFILGIGTSLPELTFGVRTAVSGHGNMSVGNLFGAAVLNSTLILGSVAIISPIYITLPKVVWVGSIFMVLTMFIAFHFLKSKDFLVRREGIFLLFIYIVFLLVQIGIGVI